MVTRHFVSRACATILSLALFTCITSTAYADEVVARFDLSAPVKQSETITLPDGTSGVLSIEPVYPASAEERSLPGIPEDLGNGNGTWNIYWNMGLLNTGYTITIKNYRISRAYDKWASSLAGYKIKSNILTYGSTWSTLTIEYQDALELTTSVRSLKGNIVNNKLETSVYAH